MLSIVIQQNAKVLYTFLIYGFQASQSLTRAYSSFGVARGVLLGSTGPRTYVYGGLGIVEQKRLLRTDLNHRLWWHSQLGV